MQTFAIFPAPRQDVLVTDAATGEPRRMTVYTGIAWLTEPPRMSSTTVLGLRAITTSGRAAVTHPDDPLQFFVPDSLAYRRPGVASAIVTPTGGLAGVQDSSASREATVMLSAAGTFVDDPQRPGVTWLALSYTLAGYIWSVSYQVTVVVAPEGVA